MRTTDTALPHPGAVLEAAERAERLSDAGQHIRTKVSEAIASSCDDWTFFVNLHPQDLLDIELYSMAAPLSSVARRVVVEITERASLDALTDVGSRVAALREMGFRIAPDDLGAGYAGLTSFVSLEPEFMKLDMSLIRDIHCADRCGTRGPFQSDAGDR